jgi:Na+-translocating ferredoxin:NAD+ oxidoreductase RNF subunit RnfB
MAMDTHLLIISMLSVGGLGLLFSAGLAIANKILLVEEDPRIEQIRECLPGANCGGCGLPGCAKFAENLVQGTADICQCVACTADALEEIAAILGVEVSVEERRIARVMCQGGLAETAKKAEYVGIQSCLAANLASGGNKLCEYGCLGFGDCVEVCPFEAIYLNENGLPVVIEEKCTGCGNCLETCPRNIIELHPESHCLFVLCKNKDKPKIAKKVCTRACIACGLCVRAVDQGEIFIKDNLAVIDYTKFGKDPELPTDKCPTDCLVVKKRQDNRSGTSKDQVDREQSPVPQDAG